MKDIYTTPNGLNLLTEWDGGYKTFEPLQKVATKAARAVRGLVEFVHGHRSYRVYVDIK